MTITVNVRYHNILRQAAGTVDETVMLPTGASLLDLLEHVSGSHGPPVSDMLFTADRVVSSHLVVFRGRKLIQHDQYDQPLADGDSLLLFPAIAGG